MCPFMPFFPDLSKLLGMHVLQAKENRANKNGEERKGGHSNFGHLELILNRRIISKKIKRLLQKRQ